MHKTVLTKSLYSLRWQIAGWSLAVFAIAFLTMAVFNALSGQGITDIVKETPDAFKSLIGTTDDFSTIKGYIGQQVFGPNVVMFTMIMSIFLFVGIGSGREDRGLTQTLLSFPVSRSRVYFAQWLAVMIVIAIVCLAIIPGIYAGLLIVDHSADWQRILLSTFACFLMNAAYGLVGYAVAMATGKRALTIAAAAGYAAVSFVVSSLAPAVNWLKWPDKFSIFHYYNNPQIMAHGLDLKNIAILGGVLVLLTVIGWLGFIRRDVRTA